MPAAIDVGHKVDVSLSEWQVTTAESEVPKGQVTFAIRNNGKLPHVVEISGGKDKWRSMTMNPGDAITMAAVLDSGEYKITCPDSAGAHEKRGMLATIKVKS